VRRYSVYNHTYHPRRYGDPVGEYWALLEGVTLWDVGVERQIEISGPDAFTFANMMTPRDLTKCAVRQAKYAFITLPDGGIANDPVLMRLEENRFWLSLPTGLAEPLGQEFEVETPTGRHHGVTVRKPFIDPGKQTPKQ
jgi:glycine cleavage system aminomethyltransferase T